MVWKGGGGNAGECRKNSQWVSFLASFTFFLIKNSSLINFFYWKKINQCDTGYRKVPLKKTERNETELRRFMSAFRKAKFLDIS